MAQSRCNDIIQIMNNINNVQPAGSSSLGSKNEEAYQALENAHQISSFLRCGVDKNTLAIMINMVESGCKPEHVAAIVAEIKSRSNLSSTY